MLKLDKNKLADLNTFDDHLQERYGDENSPKRKEFEAKPNLGIMQNSLKTNVNARIDGMKSIHCIFMMNYAVYRLHV